MVFDRWMVWAGAAVLAAAVVEWTVQSWSDRASDDGEYNSQLRRSLMQPFEFPVLGLLAAGLVVFGFSRVMLAIPKSAAVGVFIGLGALVLVIAAILSTPRRLSGAVLATVLALGGVGILTAGVVGASTGERAELHNHVEETGPEKQTSNAVADKSSVAATVVVTPDTMTPTELTLARSASLNLLFENDDSVPRQLVVDAGTEPKLGPDGQQVKDANGNVITVPVEFRSDYIGGGKASILTVTMPKPGIFSFRTQTGDDLGVIEGKVVVP